MRGNDEEVLAQAVQWLKQGRRAALVTVLGTYGASPRPPGSMALIRDDGAIFGSVSGGCVEDDLRWEIAAGGFFDAGPAVRVRSFGASVEERQRYRLPCGNSLRVAVEACPDAALLEALLQALQSQRCLWRQVRYRDGENRLVEREMAGSFAEDEDGFAALHGPNWRLLIIGGSELGRYLAQIALTLNFAVTVCEPREEYRQDWPMAAQLSVEMPDDLVLGFRCDGRTAVVAVTHDPKLDDLALMEALKLPCLYVGALGSATTTLKRKARLEEHFGLTPAQLGHLHGPVGLDIGSRTPAEIAVSIAADLVACRSRLLRAQSEDRQSEACRT
ncbi:XdhC family protein [Chromobacterium sp. IIBBL 290-4]|uniref:XdhC family protein n=1 Tax=Chromobacterium sp. IIBBL 290-4 TaxID=2953890 RepID=UPI0020B89EDC|nr:XdhC family protein [Chromobacterium sp. IIBBL 290-4]UTH72830.1 XdhC family protein [Chromobacterium sp. IIBBL 290-4]